MENRDNTTKNGQNMRQADGATSEQPQQSEQINIKFGKGLARQFTGKDGKQYTSISIPNRDPADKSPWAYFVVPSDRVKRVHFFETGGREIEIRLWLIAFLQDRSIPLGQRLARLGEAVRHLDEALTAHDFNALDDLLSGKTDIIVPDLNDSKSTALDTVRQLLIRLDDLSDSIHDYGRMALRHFDCEGALSEEAIAHRLSQASPHWEAWFENMMVNHMYFSQFPFQDRPVSLKDETVALYAVYVLLRFLTIGAGNGTHGRMADIAAALFRLVDHTAFDRYAVPILKQICGNGPVLKLLML